MTSHALLLTQSKGRLFTPYVQAHHHPRKTAKIAKKGNSYRIELPRLASLTSELGAASLPHLGIPPPVPGAPACGSRRKGEATVATGWFKSGWHVRWQLKRVAPPLGGAGGSTQVFAPLRASVKCTDPPPPGGGRHLNGRLPARAARRAHGPCLFDPTVL